MFGKLSTDIWAVPKVEVGKLEVFSNIYNTHGHGHIN